VRPRTRSGPGGCAATRINATGIMFSSKRFRSGTIRETSPGARERQIVARIVRHTDVIDARLVAEGGTGSGQYDIISTLIGLLVAGTPGYCPIVAGSSVYPH